MSAKPLVFVDTSILVYALSDGTAPRNQKARVLFEDLVEHERLCRSIQILKELYVTLTRKFRVDTAEALTVISDLAEFPFFQVDKSAILDAGRMARDSKVCYWDALVLIAATRMGAAVLLTEDLNHGQVFGSLRVENPFRDS